MRIDSYYNDRTGDVKVGKIFFHGLGLFIVAAIILGIVGFFGGWFNAAKDVVSPTNVKAQHYAIIDDWEGLQAAALTACQVGDPEKAEGDPTMVEDPATAYAATYRDIVRDYNRRQANLFEARIAGPSGYPDRIPSLDRGPDTDWCGVADELDALKQ